MGRPCLRRQYAPWLIFSWWDLRAINLEGSEEEQKYSPRAVRGLTNIGKTHTHKKNNNPDCHTVDKQFSCNPFMPFHPNKHYHHIIWYIINMLYTGIITPHISSIQLFDYLYSPLFIITYLKYQLVDIVLWAWHARFLSRLLNRIIKLIIVTQSL